MHSVSTGTKCLSGSIFIATMNHIFAIAFLFAASALNAQSASTAQQSAKAAPVYKNLGATVNSSYSELMPYITADGSKLFFVREDHPQNTQSPQETQDIWFCKREADGSWSEAKHLGFPFNTASSNTIFYQSPDGTQRIIRGVFEKSERIGDGFSVSRLTAKGWSDPQPLRMHGYERMSKGNYSGMCMSVDNRTIILYFSRKEDSSINDLYVSHLISGNEWSKPEPLGETINTPGDESTPFLAADGVTLYFSSERPGGYGSADIWVSRRLDDTWTKWSEPVNLGPTVNDERWQAYYSIAAAGNVAYVVVGAGNGGFGGTDICTIEPEKADQPKPVALINGRVFSSKTNLPVSAAVNYFTLPDGAEAGIAQSNPQNGEYQIVLPAGKLYGFKAAANGYYAVSENIDLTGLTAYTEIKRDLALTPIETGQIVRLNNIFFETGKAELRPESFAELDNLVKVLNDNLTMNIAIAGHTDDVGSDEANMKLSDDRAQAVMNYLISKGIQAGRLSAKGFGESKPVVQNTSDENRALNRRVEFTIVSK